MNSDAADVAFAYLAQALGGNPLLLTQLDLTAKKPSDSEVKLFSALLEDSHCKEKELKLVLLSFPHGSKEIYSSSL